MTSGLSEGGKAGVKQRPKERQAVGAPGQTPDHREMEGVGSVSLIPASRPPDLGKGGRFGIEGCIPASPTHPSLDLGLTLSDTYSPPRTLACTHCPTSAFLRPGLGSLSSLSPCFSCPVLPAAFPPPAFISSIVPSSYLFSPIAAMPVSTSLCVLIGRSLCFRNKSRGAQVLAQSKKR